MQIRTIVIFLSLLGSCCYAEGQSLQERDSKLFTNIPLSIEFTVEGYPDGYSDKLQPHAVGNGTAILEKEASAYEVNFSYADVPKFIEPGSSKSYRSTDYDREGKLLFWRPVKMAAYAGHSGGRKVTTFELYKVPQNATAIRSNEYSIVEDYPVGSTDYFTSTVKMAMGVGYSKYVTNDQSKERITPGESRIDILHDGGAIGNMRGIWRLSIDRESQVVRAATFTLKASGLDTTIVVTSGTLQIDGEMIAQNGMVKSSANDEGIKFSFKGAERSSDREFAARIQAEVDAAPRD